jgi:N-acetylglucosaminyldiphosphoundecaprenol N-acetyl-beta-D-mannosaminyltransferase
MGDGASLPDKIRFYNLEVNVLDRLGFLDLLKIRIQESDQTIVNFLNAHCFNIAQKDDAYRAALGRSTLLLNDGIGVDIAGRLAGVRFEENLNGTDLIPEILDLLESEKKSVFLFGARPEVIEKAVKNIRERNPALSIAGYRDGYVDDPQIVAEQINSANADAVILGLGVPMQELWVDQYVNSLTTARLLVCGGAIFDFVSGVMPRAPAAMRRMKLEWLFRLIKEPRRMFSRYVIGSFVFLYNIARLRR